MRSSENDTSLANRVAVVTGASSGIGAAVAMRLASDGATVLVHYNKNRAGALGVLRCITKGGGSAAIVQANLGNPVNVSKIFEKVDRSFGHLDILVNNAGIVDWTNVLDLSAQRINHVLNINLSAALLGIKDAIRRFPRSGGSVVNISSFVTISPPPNMLAYVCSKAALEAATKSLAQELGPRRIRVNAIAPGVISTRIHGRQTNKWKSKVDRQTALGRLGDPAEVADVVAFLASQNSRFVTGEVIQVTGGYRI